MRLSRRKRERLLTLDMTPMIDIVFQLLIFFLTTAQMVQITRADIELPQEPGEQQKQAEEAGLVINVAANGSVIVSEREIGLNELELMVRDAIRQRADGDASRVKLTIRVDRRASAEDLNSVVKRLHELGVGAARIATEPPR